MILCHKKYNPTYQKIHIEEVSSDECVFEKKNNKYRITIITPIMPNSIAIFKKTLCASYPLKSKQWRCIQPCPRTCSIWRRIFKGPNNIRPNYCSICHSSFFQFFFSDIHISFQQRIIHIINCIIINSDQQNSRTKQQKHSLF